MTKIQLEALMDMALNVLCTIVVTLGGGLIVWTAIKDVL